VSGYGEEEEFDYISAYVNGSQPNSAQEKDAEDHEDPSSGYGQGRFATHLDDPSSSQ